MLRTHLIDETLRCFALEGHDLFLENYKQQSAGGNKRKAGDPEGREGDEGKNGKNIAKKAKTKEAKKKKKNDSSAEDDNDSDSPGKGSGSSI